ncbi:TM0106 family RecB-like putative nuclease [Arthrobacter agilis]|uniref:TM0106 family RecB-like putative nuclease n=1 Tax=Arthrobacter agilis TaxID=37921 RepID=UPI0027870920|nr:TM0106 family RecB-like putative nuclease [Arthrobacter agilis]MDQ0733752.1 putative RecB family nuclease [Arthrobacter agilis]
MFLLDPTAPALQPDLVFSATDLVAASECEYRTLRILDEKLGRAPKAEFAVDELQQLAGALGDVHERRVLDDLTAQYGPWDAERKAGVYGVERGTTLDRATLLAKHQETAGVLTAGADVVFQATFFDGEFLGYADFLVRQPAGDEHAGRYAVWDTKLARHAKVGALLQLAAYGDQLIRLGLEPAPQVTLVLGNLERSVHSLTDLLPVYRERRDRFRALTTAHRAADTTVDWGQHGVVHCGRCDYCSEQVTEHRDLLMVAGMTASRRKDLLTRGITTIDALAELPDAETRGPLVRLRDQARLQTGTAVVDGFRTFVKDGVERTIGYRVLPEHTLAMLPAPSTGDIFFDFEGDPLWQDPDTGSWGLEYLFGVMEPADTGDTPIFRPFWAHSRQEERQAFLAFLEYVEKRRTTHPDLHIYHYAPYEKTALRTLSLRHGAGEDIVDDWLRSGLLVDLYATVRHSLRVSAASYSIKELEPLYMGDHLRTGDVADAGASVVAYAKYCATRDDGDEAAAATILTSITDYNEYDCLSTLRLRDWLLQLAPDAPGTTGPDSGQETAPSPELRPADEPTPDELRLRDYLAQRPADQTPTPADQAIAMVAAATGYHRRERKQFWWEHFDRLENDRDSWSDQRDVFLVESATVVEDWAKPTSRARTESRTVRLRGVLADGSDFRPGSKWFRMFDAPVPDGVETSTGDPLGRGGCWETVVERVEADPDDPGRTLITVTEKSTLKVAPYRHLPVALTPDKPLATASQEASLAELANTVGAALPTLPPHPGLDILQRAAPRLATRDGLPVVVHDGFGQADYVTAVTDAVLDLDSSYLAVQGPPGTGKTYVGSRVIARLVAEGWKVGVVAQSHAVVEHFLTTAVGAGVDPESIGKKLQKEHPVPWAHTSDSAIGTLLGRDDGCLIGGTAWTMTGKVVPPGSLDLLVIDEAGQFSLANTLAVSRASSRLMLLGDPQQLPQVTQGSHPEPVDESALGWLSAGHATLPARLGYFLADSWRMHPHLCEAVSRLSYDGRLDAAPATVERRLEGLPAGVDVVLVDHTGNTVASTEEAAEVVEQARRHLGLTWHPGGTELPRPLEQGDVLVVAAYNAQVQRVRAALDAADLPGIRVGTVDKFQGQEAAVVFVSMACSSVAEAPRGVEFLLNRNRINVAISRGQWRAVVIRSRELTNFMPGRPSGLEELGAFIGLGAGTASRPSHT